MTETNEHYANENINIIKLQNPVLLQWEIYLQETLHEFTLPLQVKCNMILQQLQLIRQADEENDTKNYTEILRAHSGLIEILIEQSQD